MRHALTGVLLTIGDTNPTTRILLTSISARKFLAITVTKNGDEMHWNWQKITSTDQHSLTVPATNGQVQVVFGMGTLFAPDEIYERIGDSTEPGSFIEPLSTFNDRQNS